MRPVYFAGPDDFRAWLQKNHAKAAELWVGFHKKATGKPSLTWPQSVDQALCFGWIDGVRKSVDEKRYTIRFTPRRASSRWSAVNLKRVKELKRLGLMQPAGLAAYEQRDRKSAGYSFEQRHEARLDPARERAFRADAKAWAFFEAQAPWYRRTTTFWVMSAKKEETRDRRFATLLEHCRKGTRIPPLTAK